MIDKQLLIDEEFKRIMQLKQTEDLIDIICDIMTKEGKEDWIKSWNEVE